MRRGSGSGSAAGAGSKGGLQCTVRLLDGSNIQLEVNKKSSAQATFDQVLRHLSIKEKEYFALEYEDEQKHNQWVDLQKPLKKQIKKPLLKVNFRVKYYPLDPMVPHASCRNHFYQQLRSDIIEGTLKCPLQTSPCIIAYVLQADLGDFESMSKDLEYIMEQKLLMNESSQLHEEIARFHQLYRGMNVMEAVNSFLRKVRELDTYGIRLFEMRFEDSACQLGISPGGISIFRRNRRIMFYEWSMVVEVSFKSKRFVVTLTGIAGNEMVVSMELESLKLCKDVWRISAECASFYSDPSKCVREEQESSHGPAVQNSGAQVPVDPFPRPSEVEAGVSAVQQKTRSLPQRFPGGEDPIAAALKLNRDKTKNLSPTSPTSFTSMSSSMSDQVTSPLSPGGVSSEMDLMLPGMPNLQDEEGRPFVYPTQHEEGNQMLGETGQEVGRRYRENVGDASVQLGVEHGTPVHLQQTHLPNQGRAVHHVLPGQMQPSRVHVRDLQDGEAHVERNGFSEQGYGVRQAEQRHLQPTNFLVPNQHGGVGLSNGEAAPPLLPPRNYNSQYRSDFHARNSPKHQQSPARSRQNHPASYRHSTSDRASNASGNLSQEMDGSLLDLADELGTRSHSSVSMHSSLGRRSQTDLGVASGYPMSNGKYSPHHGQFTSHTLPSTFDKRSSSEASPPQHSPRGPATGTSMAGGRGIVRTWVQEQQLRSYDHSNRSQHSLDSGSSQENPSSRQHSQGSHPSPPELKGSQASSRSSNSLPRGNFSSSSLQKEREDRWRSLSMENKAVVGLQELDFSSKGGSRVYQQFRDMIASDEHLSLGKPLQRSPDQKSPMRSQNQRSPNQRSQDSRPHDQRSHDPRSHDSRFHGNQRSLDNRPHQRFSDESRHDNQRSSNQTFSNQRSHIQRSHDQPLPQADHQQQVIYDRPRSQEGLLDQRLGSDGHDWYHINQNTVQENGMELNRTHENQRMTHNQSEQVTKSEYPLPTSPAPPPYKSPSPDSEQAQVLQQLERRPPRTQFAYHASSLGMGMEEFTDLSAVADTNLEERVNRQNVLNQTRSPRRQRVVRSPSPAVNRQKGNEVEHLNGTGSTSGPAQRVAVLNSSNRENTDTTASDAAATGAAQNRGGSPECSGTSDILREIEELMGGVEAMVSDVHAVEEADGDLGTGTATEPKWSAPVGTTVETSVANDIFVHKGQVTLGPGSTQAEHPPTHTQERSPPCPSVESTHTPVVISTPDQMLAVAGASTAIDTSFGGSNEEMEFFSHVSAPAGFGGEEEEEEREGRRDPVVAKIEEGSTSGTVMETRNPEVNIQGPEIVVVDAVDQNPLPQAPSDQADDNLANILQEVREAHNLPPPPAHLMALSQELESSSQEQSGDPLTDGTRALPSIATTTRISANTRQQVKKEEHPAAKYDPKLFSRKKVELPPLSYENVTSQTAGTAHLPLEIANFMNRVRNLSFDSSDSYTRRSLSESSEVSRHKVPLAGRASQEVEQFPQNEAAMWGTKPSYASHDGRQLDSELPLAVETVSLQLNEREAESAANQISMPHPDPNFASMDTDRTRDSGSVREDNRHHPSPGEHLIHSNAGRELKRQAGDSKLNSQIPRGSGSLEPQGKALKLPYGEAEDFNLHYTQKGDIHSPSHNSSPLTSQPPSSLGAPIYPRSSQEQERRMFVDETTHRNSQEGQWSIGGVNKGRSAKVTTGQGRRDDKEDWNVRSIGEQSRRHEKKGSQQHHGHREHEQVASEGRRTQTSGGSGSSLHHHQGVKNRPSASDRDLDSLPNSPTYFSELAVGDRATPSPRTQAANKTFQDHLDSLDAQAKMKKKKVMDWIQKSSNEAWDRENDVKSRKDPSRLQLDPDSHLPAKQYLRQEPIYATADEDNLATLPSADSCRTRSSGSVPNRSAVPEWRSGAVEQRYRMEPRHRVATVGGGAKMVPRHRVATVSSGSRIEPVGQRQYPPAAKPQGRDGQSSSGQPSSYPTAHFEKDYYFLDV